MLLNRSGETGNIPERQDRFFQKDDYWYYTTREGVDIGPFDSFDEAVKSAEELIEFITGEKPAFSDTLQFYSRKKQSA